MAKDSDKFSGLVKEVRSQLGFSQEDLAHEIGVSFSTVNRWENGKTNPSKMARNVFKQFCKKKVANGELKLLGVEI
jgi:putative transcriptional regulator